MQVNQTQLIKFYCPIHKSAETIVLNSQCRCVLVNWLVITGTCSFVTDAQVTLFDLCTWLPAVQQILQESQDVSHIDCAYRHQSGTFYVYVTISTGFLVLLNQLKQCEVVSLLISNINRIFIYITYIYTLIATMFMYMYLCIILTQSGQRTCQQCHHRFHTIFC
jgi:hypothetical protein